jgi:ADP-heptose:LPS heptosyltransferase
MITQNHILVLRFSAMGDVAMTVPVVKELLQQNPHVQITYVSRPAFAAFFEGIDRLTFIGARLSDTHKGLAGIYKLYTQLKKTGNYQAVANLHNNLRSNLLQWLFRLNGVKGQRMSKGRAEKKQLTRFPNKLLKPLRPTTERYADVFRKLGFALTLSHQLQPPVITITHELTGPKQQPWVGIAPFAQHQGKIYPLGRMEQVIQLLNRHPVKIFVFGGSAQEQAVAEEWQQKYPSVTSVVNQMSLQQELQLIAQLNVMLAMDSAGMHMASLQGVPAVSVWGATHHFAGFLGYGQLEANVVADDIGCRPCSVYGNKPCFRNDYACLYNIEPQTIVDKLLPYLL